MLHKVFSIFDSKVGAYQLPFFRRAKGEAIRDISDSVNSPESGLGRHPEDFTLFELGVYDDSTGVFEQYPAHVSLGILIEFKRED